MAELDRGFISALLHQKNLNLVHTAKIKAEQIIGPYRKAFCEILSHYNKYGRMPKLSTVREIAPEFKPIPEDELEPMEFYCREIQTRAIYKELRQMFEEGAERLPENPIETVALVRQSLSKINTEFTSSSDVEIADNIESRIQDYEKAESGLTMGVPFPWETLNEASMGMQPEDLVSIVADTGVGKSWALIIVAAHAFSKGYHILFFTREMSAKQIRARFEAVHGGFPHAAILRGRLDTKQKRRYYEYLHGLKNRKNHLWISGDDNYDEKVGIDLVEAKIDEYQALVPNPEKFLVIVDGAYFLSAESSGESDGMDWKVIAKVTQGLKRLARKKKVPILISSQAKRGTKNKAKADQSDVGFSYSIVQDSNILIMMNQNEELRAAKTMQFWTAKMRDAAPVAWSSNWDMESMDFSEFARGYNIKTDTYEGDDYDEEDRKSRYGDELADEEDDSRSRIDDRTEEVLEGRNASRNSNHRGSSVFKASRSRRNSNSLRVEII